MDPLWRSSLWEQFGAAVDMLEQSIRACPDALWDDRSEAPPYWHLSYHALFYLDLYLSATAEGFTPPPPFREMERDLAAALPAEAYTKQQLLGYLAHGREKCRAAIASLTEERAARRCGFYWLDMTDGELLFYNLRHLQHHVAQLHMRLRQRTGSAPGWVVRTKLPLTGGTRG